MKSTILSLKYAISRIAFCLLIGTTTAIAQPCNFSLNVSADTLLCEPAPVALEASLNGSIAALPVNPTYLWSPPTGLNNPNINNPIAQPTVTTTYSVNISGLDRFNLIQNGDFESGNTNFTTAYNLGTGGTFGLLSTEGTYAITTSPSLAHNNFASCNDHSNPGVNMMVINGSINPNTNIWCQTMTVTPNTDYVFSMWGISAVTGSPGVLQILFNNSPALTTFNLPPVTCSWENYTTTWNSGINTTLTICIVGTNLSGSGNDFAIDDLSLRTVCTATASTTITVSSVAQTVADTFICLGDSIQINGITRTQAGTYQDTLATVDGCDSVIITTLDVRQPALPNLGADTTLCGADAFVIASNIGDVTYNWSTGSTDSTITVTDAGNYSLTVTDADGCQNENAIQINYNPYPVVELGNDTTLCPIDQRVLNASQDQGATYLWQDGSTSSTIVVSDPGGTYSVEVSIQNCSASDAITIDYQVCDCNIGVPNAFTPDGNSTNDLFRILPQDGCIINAFSMKIFNRWGELVFQTQDHTNGWDGTLDGNLQPQDAYIYVIDYELYALFNEPPVQRTGTFLLVR